MSATGFIVDGGQPKGSTEQDGRRNLQSLETPLHKPVAVKLQASREKRETEYMKQRLLTTNTGETMNKLHPAEAAETRTTNTEKDNCHPNKQVTAQSKTTSGKSPIPDSYKSKASDKQKDDSLPKTQVTTKSEETTSELSQPEDHKGKARNKEKDDSLPKTEVTAQSKTTSDMPPIPDNFKNKASDKQKDDSLPKTQKEVYDSFESPSTSWYPWPFRPHGKPAEVRDTGYSRIFRVKGKNVVFKTLHNVGNSCYLSTAVQLLDASGVVDESENSSSRPLQLLRSFFYDNKPWPKTARELISQFKDFSLNRQEDSVEFLRNVYMSSQCDVLKRFFFISSEDQIVCDTCGKTTFCGGRKYPEISVYPREDDKYKSMEMRIHEFLRGKPIEGGRCRNRCPPIGNLRMCSRIVAAPEVLTIRICRWKRGNGAKNFIPVKIDDEMDVDEIYKYRLFGVVIHHGGSVHGGHYHCERKVDDQWFICNDSLIKQIGSSRSLVSTHVCGALYRKISDDAPQTDEGSPLQLVHTEVQTDATPHMEDADEKHYNQRVHREVQTDGPSISTLPNEKKQRGVDREIQTEGHSAPATTITKATTEDEGEEDDKAPSSSHDSSQKTLDENFCREKKTEHNEKVGKRRLSVTEIPLASTADSQDGTVTPKIKRKKSKMQVDKLGEGWRGVVLKKISMIYAFFLYIGILVYVCWLIESHRPSPLFRDTT